MASSTAGTPTAAQPGSAETMAGTPLSSPAPAPPTTNAAAGTAAFDQPEAEERLVLLMDELGQLASIVHPARLRTAADRLDALASVQARTWRAFLLDNASTASPDNSPGPVEQLSFTNVPMTDDEARSVDGSIGSVDADDARDSLASPLPDDGVGPLAIDEPLWPGGPCADSLQVAFAHDDARDDADERCAPCDGDRVRDCDGDGDGASDAGDDGGAGPRDPRLWSWCRRDSVGLAQHGPAIITTCTAAAPMHAWHGTCCSSAASTLWLTSSRSGGASGLAMIRMGARRGTHATRRSSHGSGPTHWAPRIAFGCLSVSQ